MKPTVIFCQSPADIQYVLSLYEKYKGLVPISIFVVNVRNMFTFIQSLRLDLDQLVFIPYPEDLPSLRKPYQLYRLARGLRNSRQRYFNPITNSHVFYFANSFDWMSFSFLASLAARNTIQLLNHYSYEENRLKEFTPRERLRLLAYHLATGADMTFCQISQSAHYSRALTLRHEEYGIIEGNALFDRAVLQKYSYEPIGSKNDGKKVLILESAEEEWCHDYEKTIRDILQIVVESKASIYLKAHPRVGYSKFLDEYDIIMIPDHIPAEFVSLECFDAVLGMMSTATATIANNCTGNRVFTLMKLFRFADKSNRSYIKQLLTRTSGGQLSFVEDLNELRNILL